MSKRAEDAAKKAYPTPQGTTPSGRPWNESDMNLLREPYIKAYEQAEKDFALTIEDLELIHTFLYAVKNNKHGAFTFTRLSDEQYQEVLNRFNKSKEK